MPKRKEHPQDVSPCHRALHGGDRWFEPVPYRVGQRVRYSDRGMVPRVLMALEDDGETIGYNNAKHVLEAGAEGTVMELVNGNDAPGHRAQPGVRVRFSEGREGYLSEDCVEPVD